MAQVTRTQFQVYPLRGIDLRFRPTTGGRSNSSAARLIRDMTWDPNDSWKESGGYRVMRENGAAGSDGTNDSDPNPATVGVPSGREENPSGGSGGPNG